MADVDVADDDRRVYLARHGETEWSRLGRHTGRTDIPLTEAGRAQAVALGRRLVDRSFGRILTSPLARAAETARIAGFGQAEPDADLMEWDYGDLEGRRTPDIREGMPGWSIWSGPWPGGETIDDVARRADRLVARCIEPAIGGDVLLFAHGHVLRVLAARWLEQPPTAGVMFALGTATISVLGFEHGRRVIHRWNEACHLDA